jgi:amino acid adenylation domain-containing protein/thioester reductase-like protein
MEQLLCYQARRSPKAPAVIDGEQTFTYEELIARADCLVKLLHEKHIAPEEPICIFLGTGYRQIISQVAVLRAGGSCVPVDPSMPQKRLNDMLSDIDARHILTTSDQIERVSSYDVMLVDNVVETKASFVEDVQAIQVLADFTEDHRSHILFTSGSTGRPKAVQISAHSILHLASSTPVTPLEPTDRVTEVNNPGFDLSLFEIWITLLAGATIVVVPKTTATDPFGFGDFVKKHEVTVMMLPTALFTIVATTCPSAFKRAHHVIVCGEAPNVKAVRNVLTEGAPKYLWNGYGPTECTTFVTLQLIDLKETACETISIGKAVGQTKVYLLDDEMKLILCGDREGEIYLAGPGLSRGYLNQPDANTKHFLEIDASTLKEDSARPIRVFKTGDLAKWRIPTKVLEFRGRFDMQVKQDGFRVELGDVEKSLETKDGIRQAVVLQVLQQWPSADKILAAYIVPSEQDNNLSLKAVKDYAKERLPPYMVPSKITVISEFPVTAYGKIDRDALAREGQMRLKEGFNTASDADNSTQQAANELTNTLKVMVRELINVPELQESDDIFSLGMSSLEAARLIGLMIQGFGKKVTMDMLLANPTLTKLATMLRETKETRPCLVNTGTMEKDALLADDIPVVPDWQSNEEGRVFITGVTGFVGAHVLGHLLALPTVKKVACLARSRRGLPASSRIQRTMERYDMWDSSLENIGKIIVLDGEMADETLGLGEEQFTWLTNWTSVIFHVGAKVNFCEPYQNHVASNVIGTKNVLRLAALGRRKAFHYMSSIDTWGPTALVLGTKSLQEDGPLQTHLESLPYDTGYAHSQWVAEEMVRRMRARGLPVAIYRPGFTIGDHVTAMGNPDDFFARLIVGSIQIGYWPYLPDQRMEYVTVDYVCSALIHIASSNQNLGRSYSLVAPDHSQSVNIEETGTMINKAGYPVEEIPYDEWVKKLRESKDLDQNPLSPLMPLLDEPVLRELSRLQTSKYTPVYETPNAVKALADRPDICYTPLDDVLLKRYLDNWVRKGFHKL